MFKTRRSREIKDTERHPALPEPIAVEEKEPGMNIEQATENADNKAALLRREDMTRSNPNTVGDTGALLGRGSRFEGKLTFEGTVQIDGEFYGDIDSPGHLIVNKGARIEGTVTVASAIVSGEVQGTITTTGTLELRSTARINGELNIESLTVERGAFFEGQVKMAKGLL